MIEAYKKVIGFNRQEVEALFESVAGNLGTDPRYVEKDFWVCATLACLFANPETKDTLLFKGGTALAKCHDLIERFSEDIDIVVFRDALGFTGDRDPTSKDLEIGSNERKRLFDELTTEASRFMAETLLESIAKSMTGLPVKVVPSEEDPQTVLVSYESVFDMHDGYVMPVVKIEGGARSAIDPHSMHAVQPYVMRELKDIDLSVAGVRAIAPERTFLDKLMVLHGLHCRVRDIENGGDKIAFLDDKNRLSRHYYDVHMLWQSGVGREAIQDASLFEDVRRHSLISFRRSWAKLEEAKPGTIQLVPQMSLESALARDYKEMSSMIMRDPPSFDSIIASIRQIEAEINTPAKTPKPK